MENNLIKFIVYCTTCIVNNKIYIGVHETNPTTFDYYIGNGVYTNRPSTYKYSKTKFQYAINKYGTSNFKRVTIAIFDNEDDAYYLESLIVNQEFLSRPDVYNTALGGKGGSWNMTNIELYQYDSEGNYIQSYRSINMAAKAINRNLKTLWLSIKNKCKCAGYFWTKQKFEKLDLSLMRDYTGPVTIPVFQYNDLGEYECCYDSIRDASKTLKVHHSNIGKAIKLGTICHNKYFTMTYSPNFSIAKDAQIKSRYIYQYDLKGNYIAEYENMALAKKTLNIKSNIYKAIKLGRLAGGYQWSYEKLDKMSEIKPKSGRKRRVGKYDKNWNLIKEYESLSQCREEEGAGVIHVLKGEQDYAKGYRYKYLS